MLQTKKLLLTLLFANLAAIGISCAPTDSDVMLNVVPDSPVLVVDGDTSTVGTVEVTAPYFSITRMSISWRGAQSLQIMAIKIYSQTKVPDLTATYRCTAGGDDLVAILGTTSPIAGTPDKNNPTVLTTGMFGCGSVPLADKDNPTKVYNIPLILQVIGVTIDSNGVVTGRQTGSTTITLQ